MKRALWFAVATVASGALFCLALPPADLWFLGWVAFVPLLVAVRGQGFLIGFCGGLSSLFVTAYLARSGVFYAHKDFGGSDAWIFTGCGLFGFSVSILSGIWADKGSATKPLWWFAALAVALESLLLFQLPAHLALTQYRNAYVLFFVSLGGIWLASFFIWLFNLAVASWLRDRDKKRGLELGLVSVLILGGFYLWNTMGAPSPEGMKIGIVQTDATDLHTLEKLQSSASEQGAKVAVWPEFAGLVLAPGGDTKSIRDLAKRSGTSVVTSFNDRYGPPPHNAAALMTASTTSPFYYKRKLFGGEKRMHTPGEEALAVPFEDDHVGLNICFDSCYPSVIRETSSFEGVRFIALPTIDPPSPHHFIAAIHAAFTPFRAAENGISIVRADGYAYSMIVLPSGHISLELPPGQAVRAGRIDAPNATLYRRFGDWFLYLCMLAVAFGAFRYRSKPKVDPSEERLKAFAEQTLKEKGLENLLP